MAGWVIRYPPSPDEELGRWVLGEAPQLQSLRTGLQRAVLGQVETEDSQDLAERLVIVATELAGNALRHGRPPTVVLLQRSNGYLVVDVADGEPDAAPAVADQRPAGDGGLGLVLAQRLALDVGWYPTSAGKRVWATFEWSINPRSGGREQGHLDDIADE
jgi:anti-sigma regulatory factor (Ser/Thr protein kinase)